MLKDMKQLAICHDLTHQLSFHQYLQFPCILVLLHTHRLNYNPTLIQLLSSLLLQLGPPRKKPYSYVVFSTSINLLFLTSAGLLTQLGDKNLLKNNIYSSLIHACVLSCFSCVLLCNSRAVPHQAPLFMGFFRQESWSGLPCPPPGDLPNPGIEPMSSALQADSSPSGPPGTCDKIDSDVRQSLWGLSRWPSD